MGVVWTNTGTYTLAPYHSEADLESSILNVRAGVDRAHERLSGPATRCILKRECEQYQRFKTKLFAWWYFAIAAGFVLLAINRWLVGEPKWLIVLRFAIALGFSLLGYATLRK